MSSDTPPDPPSTRPRASGSRNDRGEPPLERALPDARLWLADGYNLLHCAPFRSGGRERESPGGEPFWSSAQRERLVAVARRFAHPHDSLWLVFDGPHPSETRVDDPLEGSALATSTSTSPGLDPATGNPPEFHICFAPSADDWIVRRVKQAKEDETSVVVISGDRKLGNRARHHGAAVVSPRTFLAHCSTPD